MDAAANAHLQAVTRGLLEHPLGGVTDLIPSYGSLYVEYDAQAVTEREVRAWTQRHLIEAGSSGPPRTVTIPVQYDGEDLSEASERLGLTREEFVRRHTERTYRVFAVGFSPGFPFLGELDETLRLPRRPNPRARVPAHSVATANAQTGIYPLSSPGGWNLIGRTLVSVYDPHRAGPFLLEPGDDVQFVETRGDVPPEPVELELLPHSPRHPVFRVEHAGLLDLMVDGGRVMAGRFGMSRSGAQAAPLARLANQLVMNGENDPVIEINLQGPVLVVLAPCTAAFAGFGVTPRVNGQPVLPFSSFALREGDELSFPSGSQGVRGYLAVAGGFESSLFLGSASVDLRSRVGRALRAGDVLGTAVRRVARAGFSFTPYFPFRDPTVLRLLPGPQASGAALRALERGAFTVRSADRTGIQFEGPPVPGGEVLSEAIPIGAVQVTPAGTPILLMNDRGTLGGYEKPAVLHPADLPRAAQLRVGSRVRFVLSVR